MSASPVIVELPADTLIGTAMADGAYYTLRGDFAQVVVVGVMHFTPGEFIEALNDLVDSHYTIFSCAFMDHTDPAQNRETLSRGFVNIMARKDH